MVATNPRGEGVRETDSRVLQKQLRVFQQAYNRLEEVGARDCNTGYALGPLTRCTMR